MVPAVFTRLIVMVFGTLYPAYASYKAIRAKDVKEYLKWMMYWIVFAIFTCIETITDTFFSWIPFYNEIKIMLVLWILSPITQGSSLLYKKFVHPALTNREQDIEECIARAKEQGYHTVMRLSKQGVHYATNVIMQTALNTIGFLVQRVGKASLQETNVPTQDQAGIATESQEQAAGVSSLEGAGVALLGQKVGVSEQDGAVSPNVDEDIFTDALDVLQDESSDRNNDVVDDLVYGSPHNNIVANISDDVDMWDCELSDVSTADCTGDDISENED